MSPTEQRFSLLERLYDSIRGVDGDVVELGVKLGTTLAIFTRLVHEDRPRTVWGFDAWEKGAPVGEEDEYRPMDSWMVYRPGVIYAKARKQGVPSPETIQRHVKGFVEDTLPVWEGRPIALLHIDVDTYSGYKAGLENLWPLLQKGGIAVFDEYNQPQWPGAKKAVDEYLSDKPHEFHEDFRAWARKI